MAPVIDSSFAAYTEQRQSHWDQIARQITQYTGGHSYHKRLAQVFGFLIPANSRVLEIGCSTGDLLASVQPSYGVGVDFSPEMVQLAQEKYPDLVFMQQDAHTLALDEPFDYIIMSDLLNDLWDVQAVLNQVKQCCTPRTRLIFNNYSNLWSPVLNVTRKLGLAKPNLQQNWLTLYDVENMLELAGFDVCHHWPEVVFPINIPLLEPFLNRFLGKIWPFHHLMLTNFIVARPVVEADAAVEAPSVTVLIPARNESGNIARAFDLMPRLGSRTELLFVEGNSTDDTYEAIEREIAAHPDWECQLHKQPGTGKGDAVRYGFEQATGDILMILDADLTVPPADLVKFYDAIQSGQGEFVNGVRLVYPMEGEAMRFFNKLGNKFFSWAFTWLLGQPIRDTLCGTKVLWREDYIKIVNNRHYFGDFDPFGDFDLLLGAAKLNLRFIEVPIRYRDRLYGDTNISRWRHGMLLLRMTAFAARRIKFI